MTDLARRFWAKVDKRGPDECWPWLGAAQDGGYGRIAEGQPSRRRMLAHRLAYELCVAPIPEGLEIDHLCRNPSCVNPAHLEPVTHRENVHRGTHPSAENARKTHCLRGHPLSGTNLYSRGGKRLCRACRSDRERRHAKRPGLR